VYFGCGVVVGCEVESVCDETDENHSTQRECCDIVTAGMLLLLLYCLLRRVIGLVGCD
jgi:hypothetical protein